jgi:uncharacterized phage-associated protein
VSKIDRESGGAITHLKVQKLAYYADAWYLAHFDRPLIRESFQAWAHGPVCRPIYEKYKNEGWNALEPEQVPAAISTVAPFLKSVLATYGEFSAKALERMTHDEDPWKQARGNIPPEARCETPIDKLLTRNYYAKRLKKRAIDRISD